MDPVLVENREAALLSLRTVCTVSKPMDGNTTEATFAGDTSACERTGLISLIWVLLTHAQTKKTMSNLKSPS
jgi:hypothetical protein